MNKVILVGRLARDPEVRYTQTGKAVASFSLAVSRRFPPCELPSVGESLHPSRHADRHAGHPEERLFRSCIRDPHAVHA